MRTCKQSSYQLLRRVKLMYVMHYRLHAALVDDFVGALKQLHVDFHWPFPVLSLSALQHVASGLSTLCIWGSLWAPGHNAPLIQFFFCRYIYCLLVCIEYFPAYPFSSLFLSYLFPYLSFPVRIDLLHFQAGCCKRQLNLALGFMFILCFHDDNICEMRFSMLCTSCLELTTANCFQ